IGTMLDHPEHVLIVKSTAPMVQQHDPRRWSVGRDSFVLAEGLTSGARSLRHFFIDFNHSIPEKQRGALWDALFQAFDELNITDIFQITAHKLLGTVRFSRVIMSLEPETRRYVLHMFGEIINALRGNISLPFSESDFALYPKSNDSNKAPIFFEFYDKTVPSLLPEEIKQRFLAEKENERKKLK
ncbi:Mbeg1-like protein, partial [Lactobacillus crispatus]